MSTVVRCLGNLARPRPDPFYIGNQCRAKRNSLFRGLAPRGVDIQVMLCLQCTQLCSVLSCSQARELSVLCLVQRLGGYWCSRLSTTRASSLPQAFSGSEFDRESSLSLSGGPGLVRRREPMTATIDNKEPQIGRYITPATVSSSESPTPFRRLETTRSGGLSFLSYEVRSLSVCGMGSK